MKLHIKPLELRVEVQEQVETQLLHLILQGQLLPVEKQQVLLRLQEAA